MTLAHNLPTTPTFPERFFSWFPYRFNWILRKDGNWTTQKKYPISDDLLWELYRDENMIVGLRFTKETWYLMIDIDRGSIYHPLAIPYIGLDGIYGSLEKIGLVAHFLCQSSDSEGLHLFIPFPKLMPTFKVAATVRSQLEKDGFIIKPGQLEPFPNTKAFAKTGTFSEYNGHRLPLQSGGYLVEDDLTKIGNSIEEWCDWMDWAAARQDMELFEQAMAETKWKPNYKREEQRSKNANEWELDLIARMEVGWTGSGQTNEILKVLQNYGKVFEKLSGTRLIDWMELKAKSLPGYERWCKHKQKIYNRCRDWARCCESRKFYIPYRGFPDRSVEGSDSSRELRVNKNDLRACEAKERIVEALKSLGQKVFKTTREFIRVIQSKTNELFGVTVSNGTLYDHKDLWTGLVDHYRKVEVVIESDSDHEEGKNVCDEGVLAVTDVSSYEGVETGASQTQTNITQRVIKKSSFFKFFNPNSDQSSVREIQLSLNFPSFPEIPEVP